MNYNLAIIKGDGIGPEITDAACTVLDAIGQKFSHKFNYTQVLMGGAAIDKTGVPLPQETIDICLKSDSVLLGAVGGPKWDSLPGDKRPEKGLLQMRSAMQLYANIRPALLYKQLQDASPLKSSIIENGIDIIVVRELTGGIYFGKRETLDNNGDTFAYDTESYSKSEIERIAIIAFEIAKNRGKKVTSVDKANVLDTSRLWRKTVEEVAKNYPDIKLEHMLVDNCAMQLVKNPNQFDVVLSSNMFGDILSDEAAMITGSIGLLPSSSLGATKCGLYEPIHGSAPDIAGKNIANPIATILAASMMLSDSFNLVKEANCIKQAVNNILDKGIRTIDIANGGKSVSCSEMGDLIAKEIFNIK